MILSLLGLAEANVTLCRELALASLDGEDDVFSLVEVLLQYLGSVSDDAAALVVTYKMH